MSPSYTQLPQFHFELNVEGSHHQYKHPTKKGRTTVKHPDKDIPIKTLKSIEEQSGLKFI